MSGFCAKALSLLNIPHILQSSTSKVLPGATSFGGTVTIQVRGRKPKTPVNKVQLRFPLWFLKKENTLYKESLTQENTEFIKEIVHDKYGPPAVISGISTYQINSPLKEAPLSKGVWQPRTRRTGLIGRKIGIYPIWDNRGKLMWTTLVQIIDNHVINYTPPEEYVPAKPYLKYRDSNRYGCLLVGAESADPQNYTKEYCGLFSKAGLMPKKIIGRFFVSPEAVIQPGTPLYAPHYRPGNVVDVGSKTIYRGFQGVMKRHGFKGMPATHGVTKTHRRGGNTGGGGEKGRIWPGTKMPGHMGNRWRIQKGLTVWRVNTKYNVLWLQGPSVPGDTNQIVYIYDTVLPLRKFKEAPANFPTFYPEELEEPLPDDLYHERIHPFAGPTITFKSEK